ncbi:hypothetical protein [Thiomicrorhabdus indica]|uniref:hypothetical protein n=1 Tax=Thiomicrorhabdus indica TaxID=2267253 RepID=UPI002AA8D9BB|nr:hypothetical protein [Thiomicrorhabdus indica]
MHESDLHTSLASEEEVSQPEKILTTSLVVNRDNLVVELDESWLEQARKNDSESVLAIEKILYQPLGKFIGDDNTRMYFEASLALCRLKKQVLYRPYRCDSPTHKQFMELELSPLEDGKVRMTHYLLRTEPFDKPVKFTAVQFTNNQHLTVKRCSLCNSIQPTGSAEWIEPETFFKDKSDVMTIHTVCPDCKNITWQIRRPR